MSETTNTIRPRPRCCMPGASSWASHSADSTLTAWTRRQGRSRARPVARGQMSGGVDQHLAGAELVQHDPARRARAAQLVRQVDAKPRRRAVEHRDLVSGRAQRPRDRAADCALAPVTAASAGHATTIKGWTQICKTAYTMRSPRLRESMPFRVETPAPVRELPGQAVPYYLADGDGRAHLLLGQVGRALAGQEETAGAMSVMTAVGPAGRPIPMHRHEKEHDYFFCVRGRVQVWADGHSRVLIPVTWPACRRGCCTPTSSTATTASSWGRSPRPAGTASSTSPALRTPGPRIPRLTTSPRRLPSSEPPSEVRHEVLPRRALHRVGTGPDDKLPGTPSAYFLRAGEGPRHLLFGQVAFQLMTGAESEPWG